MKTQILSGLHNIIDKYDGFLLDVFGVIHDGKSIYPDILNCLIKLSEHGKGVAFLSNSPDRSTELTTRLERLGVSRSLFQHVFTAGEEVYQHLLLRQDPWYSKLGDRCYFIGPSSSKLIDDLPLLKIDRIEEADFILVVNADDWDERLEDYQELLAIALDRDIPMICANPNLTEEWTHMELEEDNIVLYYKAKGGFVKYHGKPNKRFFKVASMATGDGQQLMIGDSLYFDMEGAFEAGIDTAFIACCLHELSLCNISNHLPDPYKLEHFYKRFGFTPNYTLSRLVW